VLTGGMICEILRFRIYVYKQLACFQVQESKQLLNPGWISYSTIYMDLQD